MAKPPPPMPPAPLWLWFAYEVMILWLAFLLRPMVEEIRARASSGFQ
jgi:hypothetical protein